MGGHYLACQVLNFVSLDCDACIIGGVQDKSITIAVAIKGIFPHLTSLYPPFKETLDWSQFAYTVDRTGTYVDPASTVLVQSMVVEGGELFLVFFVQLQKLYSGDYAPSTLVPRTGY